VTLKTNNAEIIIVTLKIQLCITRIENSYFLIVIIFDNISVFTVFLSSGEHEKHYKHKKS